MTAVGAVRINRRHARAAHAMDLFHKPRGGIHVAPEADHFVAVFTQKTALRVVCVRHDQEVPVSRDGR